MDAINALDYRDAILRVADFMQGLSKPWDPFMGPYYHTIKWLYTAAECVAPPWNINDGPVPIGSFQSVKEAHDSLWAISDAVVQYDFEFAPDSQLLALSMNSALQAMRQHMWEEEHSNLLIGAQL